MCVYVCTVCVCWGWGGRKVTVEVSPIFRAHAKASVSRLLKVITVHSKHKHLSRGQQENPCLWRHCGTNDNKKESRLCTQTYTRMEHSIINIYKISSSVYPPHG